MVINSCHKADDNISSANGTVTDIDGNVYHTVTIGTQVWMAENLSVTRYNDSTLIPYDMDIMGKCTTGAYCNYNDMESYSSTYGRLYNWYAVKTGKLAPKGWHVPSYAEWTTLKAFLGGADIAGGKLKATGSGWAIPNTGATNESGFEGLPGGKSGDSARGYYSIGKRGVWWSSTDWLYYCFDMSSSFELSCDDNRFPDSGFYWADGLSVRCLKDL